MQTDYGHKLLEIPIKNSNYKFIEDIFNYAQLNIWEKNSLKKQFFKKMDFDVSSDLVFNGTDKVDAFIRWFDDVFDDDFHSSKLAEFRPNLLSNERYKILKSLIFNSQEKSYETLKHFEDVIKWWGQMDLESVKSKLCLDLEEGKYLKIHKIKCYKNVCECVCNSHFEFLSKLMSWKDCKKDEKVKLGNKLVKDFSLHDKIRKKDFVIFYNFSNFLINKLRIKKNDTNLKALKLRVSNDLSSFIKLIKEWNFEKIKKALEWCDLPTEKLKEFKDYFILVLKHNYPNTEEGQRNVNDFLKWLNNKIEKLNDQKEKKRKI